MKKVKFIFFIALFGMLSNTIWSQTDSLGNSNIRIPKMYLAGGGGICSKGGVIGLSYRIIASNDWGGSISFNANMAKSTNVPGDYYSTGLRIFAPQDYLYYVPFDVVKEFSTTNKLVRFGIEFGLSWLRSSMAEFKLNPRYNPNGWYYNWDPNKYIKSHSISNTIGINLRVKVDFPVSSFLGIEIAAFANLNEIRSFSGLELYLYFGNVRDRN